jgi:flagellar hook-associated protein 3 FlgL
MGSLASIYSNTRAMLQVQTDELARYQEMATTGSRVNRPSDAPVDAFQILSLRSLSDTLDTYKSNLAYATDTRQVVDGVLQSISTLMTRVRELASQAASGTYNASDRLPVANEIDSILEQVVSLANTSQTGRFLFGGGGTTAPFTVQRENGQIVSVDYQGGSETLPTPVASGVEYATALVGDQVFRCHDTAAAQFPGYTGAQAGTGTPTARGDVRLTATHTATFYQAASGVAAGDSSAAGDTLLGLHHTLTIDAAAHTVSLDDGEVVAFTGSETDLKLTARNGDTAYVNLTGLASGFQGTVDIRAEGTFSTDGGLTTVPIGFSDSEAVTDSRDGSLLYVGSADIARTGVDPVSVTGALDLFRVLINLRDAIANDANLPSSRQTALLNQDVGALAGIMDHVTVWTTTNGAQLQALSGLNDVLNNRQALAKQQSSALENADITEVASELARRQVLYQMALATTSKLLSLSIVNYM